MKIPKIPSRDELDNASCSCGEDCCGSDAEGGPGAAGFAYPKRKPWVLGSVPTPAGDVPVVATKPDREDRLGAFRVRLGFGRDRYRIQPGIYAAGAPDPWSPVLVSANFKLSFDRLRFAIDGLSAWVLVLDTNGINVWCAAGKGTFGTDEVVRRVEAAGLKAVVSHRTLVLPQLGAPGVAAHEVAKRSGFRVVYGPVRAEDLKAFLAAGSKATPEMRRVRFAFKDRFILTPVELSTLVRSRIIWAVAAVWLVGLAGFEPLRFDGLAVLGAILAGSVVTPALLPWLPGRAFSAKGWLVGFVWTAAVCVLHGFPPASAAGWAGALAYLLILPALSAFLAMNFTGSSTFTSLSGVVTEMRRAIPLMILSGLVGAAAFVTSIFLKG